MITADDKACRQFSKFNNFTISFSY